MNKHYILNTVLGALMLCTISAFAQTPVELHITHKLNGGDFTYNQASKNDLGNDFNVSRIEYYISKISIKHDGGTVTKVPDHYILVDGSANVTDALGSLNITNVESVSFYIGVDTPINHADPSLQPAGHPLAPKSPSMHWGWASGYRFVAMEGQSGSNLGQNFEIHALGDDYYYQATVNVAGVNKGGKIIIPVNADYAAAIKGIDISSGMVAHGSGPDEVKLLENFRDYVFSAGFPVSVSSVNAAAAEVQVYPNPSYSGNISVSFGTLPGAAQICVYDVLGRIVASANRLAGEEKVSINIPAKGLYLLKVQPANGQTVMHKLEIL